MCMCSICNKISQNCTENTEKCRLNIKAAYVAITDYWNQKKFPKNVNISKRRFPSICMVQSSPIVLSHVVLLMKESTESH